MGRASPYTEPNQKFEIDPIYRIKTFLIHIFIIIFSFSNAQVFAVTDVYEDYQIKKKGFTHLLTFDELIQLSEEEKPECPLQKKLDKILDSPVIDNTLGEYNSNLNTDPILGDFIRVASWNIARGRNIEKIKLLFENSDELIKQIRQEKEKNITKITKIKEKLDFLKQEEKKLEEIKKQIEILKKANVIVLNEVDIGMPRTGYKNIAEELAKTLNYNYAFGVEFVEVDPTHLGLEDHKWAEENILFPNKDYVVDESKYIGFHGNAILSQYPLQNVRIIRLPEVYDWFEKEKSKAANLEVVRRTAADLIFNEPIFREVRRGGRMALLADIQIPEMDKPVTIISVHLESRTVPKCRYEQMKALLEEIRHIDNPVVLAGDLNTTAGDGCPTNIKREFKKKITDLDFIAKHLVYVAVPHTLAVSAINSVTNLLRKHNNPTVRSIPIISSNKERKLFNAVRKMDFQDGGKFDVDGHKYRATNNKRGMLSSSNERSLHGFVPTFLFDRHWQIGQFKLDWIFVKPYEKAENEQTIKKLTPFYGRTLFELNHSFKPPISDHAPITVDLPLNPPEKDEVKELKEKLKENINL